MKIEIHSLSGSNKLRVSLVSTLAVASNGGEKLILKLLFSLPYSQFFSLALSASFEERLMVGKRKDAFFKKLEKEARNGLVCLSSLAAESLKNVFLWLFYLEQHQLFSWCNINDDHHIHGQLISLGQQILHKWSWSFHLFPFSPPFYSPMVVEITISLSEKLSSLFSLHDSLHFWDKLSKLIIISGLAWQRRKTFSSSSSTTADNGSPDLTSAALFPPKKACSRHGKRPKLDSMRALQIAVLKTRTKDCRLSCN